MANEVVATNAETKIIPKPAFGVGMTMSKAKELISGLKDAETGINISPEYYEFNEVGQKIRGVFLGYTKFEVADQKTGELKVLNAIGWMDQDGNTFSNAGVSLVGSLVAAGIELYSMIEIEYLGTKKVTEGKMKRYAVRPLTAMENV